MLELIIALIPLLYLIFKECFSAQAKAKQENRKFIISQIELKKIVDTAVDKWSQNNAKDSKGASSAWDQADQ